MLFNMYIFDRLGNCVFYTEWARSRPAPNLQDEQNLLFGMLYSFKHFVQRTSPKPDEESGAFHYFRTSTYKLHYFESGSGFKIVLNSDQKVPDMRQELSRIYELIVEHAVKNPLYKVEETITCESFVNALQTYVRTLPAFASS